MWRKSAATKPICIWSQDSASPSGTWQGLIVASANDAALVLAKRVGGSLAAFEQLMNDTARQIGMQHTRFTTPSGITTPGNHSTARDLSTLARRLTVDFPEYYGYSSKQHFAYGKFEKRNKNWLLGRDPSGTA